MHNSKTEEEKLKDFPTDDVFPPELLTAKDVNKDDYDRVLGLYVKKGLKEVDLPPRPGRGKRKLYR